jgi:DNA-binding NarL/FixJ family response regulator
VKKTVFVFSALIVSVLILFQLGKYSFISGNTSIEIIISVIATVFLAIGLYINRRKGETVSGADEIDFQKIKKLGISDREYQVLVEISKGLSNKEIGKKLHISESTIKTHVSSLLVKLNAKRRTQAIQIAKQLSIIPS